MLRHFQLESDLLALETATTAVRARPTTTTTPTAAATTAATTTTETATATATAATPAVLTRLGKVETDRSAIKFRPVQSVEGALGILNRGESHIGKALGTTGLPDCNSQQDAMNSKR